GNGLGQRSRAAVAAAVAAAVEGGRSAEETAVTAAVRCGTAVAVPAPPVPDDTPGSTVAHLPPAAAGTGPKCWCCCRRRRSIHCCSRRCWLRYEMTRFCCDI
ncbi:unnamed protein product, partial [Pylaiella littoralis]